MEPAPIAAQPTTPTGHTPEMKSICIIGTDFDFKDAAQDLQTLREHPVRLVHWQLDHADGFPPPTADWAEGVLVLGEALTPGATQSHVHRLVEAAWRAGRTIALCGNAVRLSRSLNGHPVSATGESGLFLCPKRPCRAVLDQFAVALQRQPHAR